MYITKGKFRYIFIVLSILSQSVSFIFSKLAAVNIEGNTISSYVFNPFYIASLLCLVLQAFFWQKTLEFMELSKAYPYTGLIYVFVLIYTYYIFNEPIYLNNVLGTLIILVGVYVISLEESS